MHSQNWQHLQYSTSHNTHLNLPIAAFDGSHVTQELSPHLYSTSSMLAFSFPVNINFGWLLFTPTNTIIWTFLFLNFTTIQHTSYFLKLTHSYQYKYGHFTSQFQTHSYIHQHNYLNIFILCLSIQLLNFSLVFLSFEFQLSVLSFP